MGRSSRRNRAPRPAPPDPPSPRAYTLTPRQLFPGVLLLVAAGFAAGVVVQSGLSGSTPRPLSSLPAPSPRIDPRPAADGAFAIEQLKASLQRAPGDLDTRIRLGNALFDAGRYTDAIAEYEQVLAERPGDADVRTDLGICQRRSGRSDLAVASFAQAISDVPDHVNAHFNLGVVLDADLGDPASAIAAWERFLELAPGAPNAARVRDRLRQLDGGR